ncbi:MULTISPECIES: response regulator transcription factor [Kocuria]|uniref:response regulator transcription factor n=1 Tax=Kocuria TaxID=57493 RepID=UPI0021A2CCB0|nr:MULTISPECIES: response regulator transcription factor [Kocuria]MCT1545338.1 response regulator transcription factor [Kocuria rhizophila]MCT2171535.1 response regulator transcription factor [Kocuria rhizophila]MDN3461962.1 response regulator transcription factor [Kocuria sp. APC 4018]
MTESAPGTTPVRVLIVDDQPLVRGGFRMLVDSQPDLTVVGDVDDGAAAVEAVRAAASVGPDVILMDVRMPRMDGIAATREILRLRPEARIIVLTTFDLDEYALEGIQAGASGFLLKDARPEELLDAIRTVARGDAVIAPSTTRRLLSHLVSGGFHPEDRAAPGGAGQASRAGSADTTPAEEPGWLGAAPAPGADPGAPLGGASAGGGPLGGAPFGGATLGGGPGTPQARAGGSAGGTPARDPWQDPRLGTLTAREREVFELIGEGCSNGEIMQRLFLSEPTVKTHVSHILSKLDARDRVQAVVIAYETGVVLPG